MTFHDRNLNLGGNVVQLTGPFGQPERRIHLDRSLAIAEVIELHKVTFRLPTIAVLNGEPVLRGEWAVHMVRPTDHLAFIAVPGGGGSSGGNNAGKQIIGIVAALALAVAAPWAGAALFGAGTLGATLFSAAVLTGGSLLLNAIMPQPMFGGADGKGDQQQVFSANASSNTARPLDVLPVLYGRYRYAPPLASRPYAEFAGNDQLLYQLFCVTAGASTIEKIEFGNTTAWTAEGGYSSSFTDLSFEIVQPGGAITLFPANVVTSSEVAGQQVPQPGTVLGPFTINNAGTSIDRIAVDFAFPGGMFTVSDRTIGTSSVTLHAQYRAIDDDGNPTGGWADVFVEAIALASRTPQRLTRQVAVPAGRYQVQFFADTAFATDPSIAVNQAIWSGLRGYLTGFVTPPNCTLLAMKIKANEQLSQLSANQVFVTAARKLSTHTGSDWGALTETRSIAWAAADLLRNADYGLGLTDNQYDVAGLKTLDATWLGRGDTFNGVFDRAWTARDALLAILRCGRAQPVRMGGQIGFVRLEPKIIKRAVFTLRNVVRGSFSHRLVLFDDDHPDSVTGTYVDETVWAQREVLGSLASLGSDLPQTVDWFGITDHAQAWRESVTAAAINAYQREFVSFTAEWEGKLLVRGEPILVQHPFIEGVTNAAAVSVNGRVVTLDRDVEVPAGTAYLILRGKSGHEWGPCLVSSVSGRAWTLDATDKTSVDAGMGSLADIVPDDRSEPMHVIVCDGETRPFNGLVVSATPSDGGKVAIVAAIDAPEIYGADGTEITPSPWTTPDLPSKVPEKPVLTGLYAELRANAGSVELDAMWLPSAGATGGYVAQVSYDAAASWTPVYNGTANRFATVVLPQALELRVAPIGAVQGDWVYRSFTADEVPDPSIQGFDLYAGLIGLEHLQADLAEYLEFGGDAALAALDEIMANALRTVDQDAGQYTNIQRSRTELKAATGAITAAYTDAITVATGPGSALAQRISTLEATIPDLASATALSALTTRVTDNEGSISSISTALTSLTAIVGSKAAASVVTALQAQVNGQGDQLTAQSTLITSLSASYNGISAQANVQMRAIAGPSGYSLRIVTEGRTGGVGNWRAAAYGIDVPANSNSPTRFFVVAQQFVVEDMTTGAKAQPFIVQDNVVYMDTARIRDLTVDNIKIANGAMGQSFAQTQSSTLVAISPSTTNGIMGQTVTSRGGTNQVNVSGTVTTNGPDQNKYGGVIVQLRHGGNATILKQQYGYVDDDQQKDFNFAFPFLENAPGSSSATSSLSYELWVQRVASSGGWLGGEGSGVLYCKDFTIIATNQSKIVA